MDDQDCMLSRPVRGQITRRDVLKRGLIGAAGLALLPAIAAACKSATPTPAASPTAPATPAPTPTSHSYLGRKLTGTLKIGSNYDGADLRGLKAVNDAFATETGIVPRLGDMGRSLGFADQMSNYLAAGADDAFTWFSGYRMRLFADQGMVVPIDDVWANVKGNFTAAFANTVTGNDGKVYGLPVDFYPWCIFYRTSLFATNGYTVPTTWDDLIALCRKMESDGLTPIAFSDKDGWPAMGTFDILNLRINGYDFHIGLMVGNERWTDPRVTTVFEAWRKLIPFYTPDFARLTWQQATDTLVRKQAGMFYLGLFMTGEVTTVDPTMLDDIDFFQFPFFGNAFDAEKALDAPVDIWMMAAKSPTLTADLPNVKAYLEFWARGSTQLLMYEANHGFIPTASDVDPATFDVLTKKAVSMVSQAQRIARFMDRDTRPDFAGASGMQSFLMNFLMNPNQDLAVLQKTIQAFWDVLPIYKRP